MNSTPPGVLWFWSLIKFLVFIWIAVVLIRGLLSLRKEGLRNAEIQRIMDQGGPKTIEEVLFLFPNACTNCGYTKWICRKRWGYHRHMIELDEPGEWQAVTKETTDLIVLIDRECVRCGHKPDSEMQDADYRVPYYQAYSGHRSDEELNALLDNRGSGVWVANETLEVTEEAVSPAFPELLDRKISDLLWSPDSARSR